MEKRERQELLFSRGRDFLHTSYMEDVENVYDEALIDVLSEHHRFWKSVGGTFYKLIKTRQLKGF